LRLLRHPANAKTHQRASLGLLASDRRLIGH
jgi:hypothetical protein